jgi:UDP-glucose 4-epimerase
VPRPISPYGASKLCGEAYCHAYFGAYRIPTVALRFSNVYGGGSGHKGSVVAAFLKRAIAGQSLLIYGDGRQTRDFIYLDDLLDAIVLAATVPNIGGEIFQVGTGVETSVIDLANRLAAKLKAAGWGTVDIEHRDPLPGDAKRNFADVTKAKRLLGWVPKTSLSEGLDKTVTWFVDGGLARNGQEVPS